MVWHSVLTSLPGQKITLPTNLPARPCWPCPLRSLDGQLGLYNLNELALDPKDGRWHLPKTLVAAGRRSIATGDLGSATSLLIMAHEEEGELACFALDSLPAACCRKGSRVRAQAMPPCLVSRQTLTMRFCPATALAQAAAVRPQAHWRQRCAMRWVAPRGLPGWHS